MTTRTPRARARSAIAYAERAAKVSTLRATTSAAKSSGNRSTRPSWKLTSMPGGVSALRSAKTSGCSASRECRAAMAGRTTAIRIVHLPGTSLHPLGHPR